MPRLLDHLTEVAGLFEGPRPGLMADVDGTLSEMAVRPEEARVPSRIRESLRKLSQRLPVVAVVSGRSARDAFRMVGLEELVYFGNHGMECIDGGERRIVEAFRPYLPELRTAIGLLAASPNIPGVWLEDKEVSVSLHYRHAQDRAEAHQRVLQAIDALPNRDRFRIIEGKMVVNLLPAAGSSKGTAIAALVRERRLSGALFMGDDVTDLDAFRAIRELRRDGSFLGINVAVLGAEPDPGVHREADYALQDVNEVSRFLAWLVRRTVEGRSAKP